MSKDIRIAALRTFSRTMQSLARRSKAYGIDEKSTWHFARVEQVQKVLGVKAEKVPDGCGIRDQAEWHKRWLRDALRVCGRKPSARARRSAWLWARAADALARLEAKLSACSATLAT